MPPETTTRELATKRGWGLPSSHRALVSLVFVSVSRFEIHYNITAAWLIAEAH